MSITASALQRIMICPPSAVLTRGEQESAPSADADRGRALHLAAEGNLDEVDEEHRAEAEILDLDLSGWELQEQAFAYDVATGRGRLLDVTGRDYGAAGLSPFEIPGTADLMSPARVGDLKSGFRDVAPPAENPQLLVAAAANADIFGVTEVEVVIIDIRDPANPRHRSATVDTFELEIFRDQLNQMQLDVAAARQKHGKGQFLPVVEGDHCRYCPAMMSCPAKQNMLERISSGDMSNEIVMTWAALTPANARRAYEQRQMVQMVLKEMDRRLYAYAAETPIELGNGKVFGKRTKMGNESIDGHVAWTTIKEAFGVEVAEQACGFTATKKSIRDALRTIAGKGELSKKEKLILEAIRERGGASRKETTTVDEHRSK